MRKLGVKGKEDDTKKPGSGAKEGGGTGVDKKEFPTLSRGIGGSEDQEGDSKKEEEGGGGEKEEGEEEESGGEHGGGGGQFSRRKMHSNAWRYEQEEEELVPGEGEYFECLADDGAQALMEYRTGRTRAGTGLCCHDEGAKRPTGET